MEITKTLLINAACLLIPPVVVVLLLRHFFPRKIRWSAGVVALVDLVIFWTDISYYESVWLTLFFVVIQLWFPFYVRYLAQNIINSFCGCTAGGNDHPFIIFQDS